MTHKTILCLTLLVAALSSPGCQRAFYRRQADLEAYNLVREKANHPHWSLDNYTIAVDPRSRMYDPYCADCPPMPPDDPAAHDLMHCVDKKRGWPFWHDNGDAKNVENPAWPAYIEFDERGTLQVSSDDAVRLGFLHSRDYQEQLENLYLSALDVSFERFRFDSQFFAGYEVFYTAEGRLRSGAARQTGQGGESRSILEANTFSSGPRDIGFSRLFSTGGELVVGFANSLVWQLSGPDDYNGNTLIDFALVQPLLRNAGRDRVLEQLTVTERNLLANVRATEQFRQGFYVQVMTGRDAQAGPGASGTGGYLGLLRNQQEIRNQEDNVERLRTNLFRLQQFFDELRTRSGEQGLVNNILRQDLQVAQARQALFNAESRLLTSRNSYQATLDGFKGSLGLPPQLCMDVSDNMLDQFQLIEKETIDQLKALELIAADFGAVRQRIVSHVRTQTIVDPDDPTRSRVIRVLPWYPELPQDLEDLKARLDPIREIRDLMLSTYLPTIEEDIARFEASIPRRKERLQKLYAEVQAQREEKCPLLPVPDINAEIFRTARLDESREYARAQLAALSSKIQTQYETHLQQRIGKIDEVLSAGEAWTPERLFNELYEGVLYPKQAVNAGGAEQVTDILVVLPSDILALQLVQARARTESIEIASVDLKAEQAMEIARKYRRDWMNARAALVDNWRLIQFNADQLQSGLDVFFSGDVGNVGQNPFNLNTETGRLRVGVQFDAPLTRLAERNTYRRALINYQQARRDYYTFEDSIARGLRTELRTLYTNQLNFELQRQAVLIAAQQIDRNEDIRIDQELSNQGSGATAARDQVSALADLLDAQNSFLFIWVNYETLRRSLDLDLGTLQLDAEGLWIDPGQMGEDYGQYDPWLWRTGCQDPRPLQPFEITPSNILGSVHDAEHQHLETLPRTQPAPSDQPGGAGDLPPPGQEISIPSGNIPPHGASLQHFILPRIEQRVSEEDLTAEQ